LKRKLARLPTGLNNSSFWAYFKRNISLYMMIFPGLALLILFRYVPMYGLVIAFQKFYPYKGILNSEWVGFRHFTNFFNSIYFARLVKNNLLIGLCEIIFIFPTPIIFALLVNEIRFRKFKKITQTISYMPHFISTVIVIGLLKEAHEFEWRDH
jgi:putative aldouronate transport system permease protein